MFQKKASVEDKEGQPVNLALSLFSLFPAFCLILEWSVLVLLSECPPPDLIPDSLLKDCDCHSPEIERKVNSNEWDRS